MTRITLKPLDQQVIVITGASSGIGLVTARMAALRGAAVVLVARGEKALADAVRGIERAGGRAAFAVADVGDVDALNAAADAAIARFGRIDTWINNAGVVIYARLVDTPAAEHERLFRTNYWGTVNGNLIAIARMRAAGTQGAVITVGSIGSDVAAPIMSAYSASKFALKAYVQALRQELRLDSVPIAITLIKPSGVSTPIAEHAAIHVDGEARIPSPKYDPAVVATAILDAAENVRQDVTVGGRGRIAAMVGSTFPRLTEWVASRTEAPLVDRSSAPTPTDNLFAPVDGGRERSRTQSGRTVSVYNAALRHPWATRLATAGVIAAGAAIVARRTGTALPGRRSRLLSHLGR